MTSDHSAELVPILEAIADRAARLCESRDARIFVVEGGGLRYIAGFGEVRFAIARLRPLTRGLTTGRAVIDRTVVHLEDMAAAEKEFPEAYELHRSDGNRTTLAVPLVSEGKAIGAILLRRAEVRPFDQTHIELVKAFADQAATAIENLRLSTELKTRNADLSEALEQQTATAEILKVIASSPSDVQPVFDAIVETARRLLGGFSASVARIVDGMAHLAAFTGTGESGETGESALKSLFPAPLSERYGIARAAETKAPFVIRDSETHPDMTAEWRKMARQRGFRSILYVPMLREGVSIGTINVTRSEPGTFSDHQTNLLQTFADQAVIAIENVRLFKELQARNAELAESLEQQTVTADILTVISSSPTDTQPVFDAIVKSGVDLFGGMNVSLRLVKGDQTETVASTIPLMQDDDRLLLPVNDSGIAASRSILCREVVQFPDIQAQDDVSEDRKRRAARRGFRAIVSAPLLREQVAIGAIAVTRATAGAFTEKQIALLKTFADQAVIAIENVRLFKELEARNRELTRLLEQQTATSDILGVISRSPTDVAPVFETILKNAANLCGSPMGAIFRFDGELVHIEGTYNWPPEALASFSAAFPSPPNLALISGRVIQSKSPVREADVFADPDYDHALAAKGNWRRMLGVPLLRDDEPIGVINLGWPEPGETPEYQVELLKTFASQAVIAIENVRLFNETKEALEQQTATADVLKVISNSPTDIQPVFDAIAESAARVCGASDVLIREVDGDTVRLAAHHGALPVHPDGAVRKLSARTVSHRALIERRTIHIRDIQDPRTHEQYPDAVPVARSMLVAPLLREDTAIGVIILRRQEIAPFSDKQVKLLETFANQAVIAIENVRLFKELQARNAEVTESLEQQTVTAEILKVISRSPTDVQPVFDAIVKAGKELFSGMTVSLRLAQGDHSDLVASTLSIRETGGFVVPNDDDSYPTTRGMLRGELIQVQDAFAVDWVNPRVRQRAKQRGWRAIMVAPMMRDNRAIGTINVNRAEAGPFTHKQAALLQIFADQAVIAIENVRLFKEIQDKSRQLEIANKHKSEFLANMSHELRTPLNSVIGFSDLMLERLYGELNEKQENYIRNIQMSGKHLLSLINDILDLSKIEAGRMELDVAAVHVPSALQNAMMLMRERAQRQGIALSCNVDPRIADVSADERKLKQIMLNLLTNAVKFTPQGGRVDVDAHLANGHLEVSVRDTGVGIAKENQQAVFEQFRQVDRRSFGAQEGTGLGLALSRRFAELHGGTIRLESEPGRGSTFTLSIPVRQ